jgi:xanthine dehydrogenase accessory factor
MTHSHALDFDIVERALRRSDARYVGMIGSETKAAKLRSRLRVRGVDASRVVSPIGLFKAGKHPAEVAVSAVAQLLKEREAMRRPAAPVEESNGGRPSEKQHP